MIIKMMVMKMLAFVKAYPIAFNLDKCNNNRKILMIMFPSGKALGRVTRKVVSKSRCKISI